jgi:hypothetical protein
MNAEQDLFAAFVVPAKRARYIELLGSKRGRETVRRALDHFTDLDPRFCRRVHGSDADPADVLAELRKLGAPTRCHVISVNAELDGRDMPLSEALGLALGRGQGTFLSCVSGALGPNDRYICHRDR